MSTFKKRSGFLAFALATSLSFTTIAPIQPTEASTQTAQVKLFTDIPEKHVYANEIYTMRGKNIINGYEDNTFRPNETITRKHAAALVYRAVQSEKLTASQATETFKKPADVAENNQYYNAIKYLMERDLLNVDNKNNINLNAALTRGEMANILATVFDLEHKSTYTFTDTVGTAYDTAVQKLYANGITTGYDDNTFKPNNTLTRAHYTVFMHRALNVDDNYEAKPIDDVPNTNSNTDSDDTSANIEQPVEQKPVEQAPPKEMVNTEPVKIGAHYYVPANHVAVDTSKHNASFKITADLVKAGTMKPTTNTSNLDIQPVDLTHPTLGLPTNYVESTTTIRNKIKSLNISTAQQTKNRETAMKIHKDRKFSVETGGTLLPSTLTPLAVNVQRKAGAMGVSVNQYVASYKYVLNTGNLYDGGTYVLYIHDNTIKLVADTPINFEFVLYNPTKLQ